MSAPYVDPASLLPALGTAAAGSRAPAAGRVRSWNAGTRANTVTVNGSLYTNLPVCSGAEAVLAVDVTVLVIRFEDTWVIVDRIRIP